MSIKNAIVKAYNTHDFTIRDQFHRDIDSEIEKFILKINTRKGITTTNSCAGHSKEEKGTENDWNPYLTFLVNESGWQLFWGTILPEITEVVPVIVMMINTEKAKSILIRAEVYSDKPTFWPIVEKAFLNNFTKNK